MTRSVRCPSRFQTGTMSVESHPRHPASASYVVLINPSLVLLARCLPRRHRQQHQDHHHQHNRRTVMACQDRAPLVHARRRGHRYPGTTTLHSTDHLLLTVMVDSLISPVVCYCSGTRSSPRHAHSYIFVLFLPLGFSPLSLVSVQKVGIPRFVLGLLRSRHTSSTLHACFAISLIVAVSRVLVRTPEEAVSRYMSNAKRRYQQAMFRWGHSIKMERGQFYTAEGQLEFGYKMVGKTSYPAREPINTSMLTCCVVFRSPVADADQERVPGGLLLRCDPGDGVCGPGGRLHVWCDDPG